MKTDMNMQPQQSRFSERTCVVAILPLLVYSTVVTTDTAIIGAGAAASDLTARIVTLEIFNFRAQEFFLAIASLAVLWLCGVQSFRRALDLPALVAVLLVVPLLIFLGLAGAQVSPGLRVSTFGPEVRGLIGFAFTALTLTAYFRDRPERANAIINFTTVAVIGRCVYEIVIFQKSVNPLLDRWVVDQSTLFIASILSVVLVGRFVLFRREPWSLVFGIILALIVFVSFRRTSILILSFGLLTLVLQRILKRDWKPAFAVVGLALPAIALVALSFMLSDRAAFGIVSDRLRSIVDIEARAGSNFEHLSDFMDALHFVAERPLMGWGVGTEMPMRTLDIYGELIPFHTPHLHSWIRFGILGPIAYLAFTLWVVRRSFTRTLGVQALYSAALLGYLLGSSKWPPFYLDVKTIWIVAIAFSMSVVPNRIRDFSRPQ